MRILQFNSFVNESLDPYLKETVEKYYTEIKESKPNEFDLRNKYFFSISNFGGSYLFERKPGTLLDLYENKKDSFLKYLKTLLTIELRLDNMATLAIKETPKGYKKSTKGNIWGEDKYAKAKEIYGVEIEKNIENFEKILKKINDESEGSNTPKEVVNTISKPVSKENSVSKTTDPQVRYKELLSEWKESQKKLGKNTSPGQGTRARLMKQVKSELGIKENKEDKESSRYMFFSNLEQIRRQAGLLLDMDEESIEEILENGHDWAQDHIATSKESIDQVFDFLMNQSKGGDIWKSVDLEDREDIMNDESEEDMKSEEGQNIKGFEDFQ